MKKPKFIPEFDDIPTSRIKMPELAIDERRLNFTEVELGFTEELALAEAGRCLSCRRCIGCGLCLAECDRDAIVYDQEPMTTEVAVDRVVLASGSSAFDATLKPELGYQWSMNVVTIPELERILSPTGPYAGLPLRPGDGAFPRSIAFVQCVGSREEGIGADYCSSTCCTDALELSSVLSDRLGDVEITILHRGMRPLGRRGEQLFRLAEQGQGPRLVMAMVTRVEGPDCEGQVSVTFDAGSGETQEAFDLVVLSVGRTAGRTRGTARRFRADTNKFGFLQTSPLSPVESSAEHTFAAGAAVGPIDNRTAAAAGAAAAAAASRGRDYAQVRSARLSVESSPVESSRDVGVEVTAAPPSCRDAPSDAPAVVCVCEQGMAVSELTPSEVIREAGRLDEVTLAVSLRLACGHESIARLRELAGGLGPSRVVVVGCFPDTHAEVIAERLAARLPSAAAVSIVGIGRGDSAGGVADRVRSALTGGIEPEVPSGGRPAQRVLVIGGGLAGMVAAAEVAAHGVPVTLAERSGSLGGSQPVRVAVDPDLSDRWNALKESVADEPLISVRLNATLDRLERSDGGFVPTFVEDGSAPEDKHGALIVATGAEDHKPAIPAGAGGFVLSQRQLAAALSEGREWGSVAMIQCVGSRSREHPWCSRTCCADALRNAIRLKLENPSTDVTILHRGVRVWGFDEELLSEAIERGVAFVEVADTAAFSADGGVRVEARGADGGTVSMSPDVAVLSTGVEPLEQAARMADLAGLECASDGFLAPAAHPASRGGPGGFLVEVCGRAAGPAELDERVSQAQAAAVRACLFVTRGDDET
jgi:heterodisulfide reductase subunit A-like polyferredoxin